MGCRGTCLEITVIGRQRQGEEVHGRREGTMSALTTDREGAKRRIEDLKQELREAKKQIAVEEHSDTMFTVSGDESGTGTSPRCLQR